MGSRTTAVINKGTSRLEEKGGEQVADGGAGFIGRLLECLLSMLEALGSSPSTSETNWAWRCTPVIGALRRYRQRIKSSTSSLLP